MTMCSIVTADCYVGYGYSSDGVEETKTELILSVRTSIALFSLFSF